VYSIHQYVEAVVDSVFPFGVFVTLPDQTRAYIRRRELTISGDADPREVVAAGDLLKAVIIQLDGPDHFLELSVREHLPDPWEDFCQCVVKDPAITVIVKNMANNGIFVQVIPGIDGFIPLEEMATWDVTRPEDLVWTGDRVEAVITHLDTTNHKVRLSVKRRLEQLDKAQHYLEGLQKPVSEDEETYQELEPITDALESEWKQGLLSNLTVLVLEDRQEVREPLAHWLTALGCKAHSASNAAEALALCSQNSFHVLLVDLELPQINGVGFIEKLYAMGKSMPIAVMSNADVVASHLHELQNLQIAQIFLKPLNLDEVQRFLFQLSKNGHNSFRPDFDSYHQLATEAIQPFQGLAAMMRSGMLLEERFQRGLEQILHLTRAEQALLFHLDQVTQAVTVVAQVGSLPIKTEAVYALVSSPVKDVIAECVPIWEKQVSQQHNARFRKLLDLLPFESCIGVPVEAVGRAEYGIFIFHRTPDAFSHYRLRDMLGMATFFSAALESQGLNEHVKSLSRIFLSGQLAAGFGHEVSNQLSAQNLQLSLLRKAFSRLERDHPAFLKISDFQEARQTIEKAFEIYVGLDNTVKEFSCLMKPQKDGVVDVSKLLHTAETQVRPLARRSGVELSIEPDANLPLVKGNETGLLQVFLNLMINAIQQLETSPAKRRLLVVRAFTSPYPEGSQLEITFTDTGPGIHHQLWEKIFALGFTTRKGGSGLGLFIARSLVESMGGKLLVKESRVPFGTTFLISLPIVP